MNPSDNKRLFLDMQEHPEKYSDEQLEAMMTQIDRVPDIQGAWKRFDKTHTSSQTFTTPYFNEREVVRRRWLRIAVMLGGVIFLAGITFAALHLFTQHTPKEPHQAPNTTFSVFKEGKGADPVVFENVPLDSILTVVASHYKKVVVFQDGAPRLIKLIMTWHPDAPLTDFIDRLSAFDGLKLHLQNDTIIVEQSIEEEDE